jgi:hypothetical protein
MRIRYWPWAGRASGKRVNTSRTSAFSRASRGRGPCGWSPGRGDGYWGTGSWDEGAHGPKACPPVHPPRRSAQFQESVPLSKSNGGERPLRGRRNCLSPCWDAGARRVAVAEGEGDGYWGTGSWDEGAHGPKACPPVHPPRRSAQFQESVPRRNPTGGRGHSGGGEIACPPVGTPGRGGSRSQKVKFSVSDIEFAARQGVGLFRRT